MLFVRRARRDEDVVHRQVARGLQKINRNASSLCDLHSLLQFLQKSKDHHVHADFAKSGGVRIVTGSIVLGNNNRNRVLPPHCLVCLQLGKMCLLVAAHLVHAHRSPWDRIPHCQGKNRMSCAFVFWIGLALLPFGRQFHAGGEVFDGEQRMASRNRLHHVHRPLLRKLQGETGGQHQLRHGKMRGHLRLRRVQGGSKHRQTVEKKKHGQNARSKMSAKREISKHPGLVQHEPGPRSTRTRSLVQQKPKPPPTKTRSLVEQKPGVLFNKNPGLVQQEPEALFNKNLCLSRVVARGLRWHCQSCFVVCGLRLLSMSRFVV